MRKNLLSMFAVAAGLLMATSCSTKQEEEVTTGGEAVVTFTAQLPSGLGSRAPQKTTDAAAEFGDGKTATKLQYAVYKVTGDEQTGYKWELIEALSKDEDSKTLSDLKATVSLQLVNGNTYAVAFWADATKADKKSIYTFNKTACTITATYTTTSDESTPVTKTASSSDETLDAFYAVKTFTVNGSSQETIELKRPFAQLNIGTADLDAAEKAGQKVTAAGITVTVPNTLNLMDGKVSGDEKITFAQATLPKTEKFPVDNYSYLTMNYLLTSADKTSGNTVTISYDNGNVLNRTFENVPLQRNYRTNIYGNLLTSTTQFNVEIKPVFDERANDVEIWDGKTTRKPELNDDDVLEIYYPSEWAYLCKNGYNSTDDATTDSKEVTKSIKLMVDLDFGGNDLGSVTLSGKLTVDGQGHTIKNVRLVGDKLCPTAVAKKWGTYHASLFCSPIAGTYVVKDLTVKNAKVYCPHEDYGDNANNIKGHAAVIFATFDEINGGNYGIGVTLSNVHVIGADIYGIQPVAGLIGRTGIATPIIIDKCSVEDCYLHNKELAGESGFVASFIGRDDKGWTVTITNSVAKNNKIEAYYSNADNRGINTINLLAPSTINTDGVQHSGNTVTRTCVETGKSDTFNDNE